MKILVADTSPLISLIVINKLYVLQSQYPETYIPESVWDELYKHPFIRQYQKEMDTLKNCVRKVSKKMTFPEIDSGEADAISLYKELNADLLLIDDKKGRQIAEQNEVNCIGTLALLIAARKRNLIPLLHSVFAELLKNNRYYQKELLNRILAEENEALL